MELYKIMEVMNTNNNKNNQIDLLRVILFYLNIFTIIKLTSKIN